MCTLNIGHQSVGPVKEETPMQKARFLLHLNKARVKGHWRTLDTGPVWVSNYQRRGEAHARPTTQLGLFGNAPQPQLTMFGGPPPSEHVQQPRPLLHEPAHARDLGTTASAEEMASGKPDLKRGQAVMFTRGYPGEKPREGTITKVGRNTYGIRTAEGVEIDVRHRDVQPQAPRDRGEPIGARMVMTSRDGRKTERPAKNTAAAERMAREQMRTHRDDTTIRRRLQPGRIELHHPETGDRAHIVPVYGDEESTPTPDAPAAGTGEDIHYEHYKRMIPTIGREAAVQRARNAIVSHVQSRDFGESDEAFFQRSPRYRGLRRFVDEHASGPAPAASGNTPTLKRGQYVRFTHGVLSSTPRYGTITKVGGDTYTIRASDGGRMLDVPHTDVMAKARLCLVLDKARKLHGRRRIGGLRISIENRKGSIRRGVDHTGKPWETKLPLSYGYVQGSVGLDGDQVDVFVKGDHPESCPVFLVTLMRPPTFTVPEEQKAFIGLTSSAQVKEMFCQMYKDPRQMGPILEMSFTTFKEKVLATGKEPGALQAVG